MDELEQLLGGTGVEVTGEVEVVRKYPWSIVYRVPSSDGVLYAKRCGPGSRFEPALLQLFADSDDGLGPPLVAARGEWLVTRDAGSTLHEAALPSLATMIAVQPRYVAMQRRWMSRVDELAAIGVPQLAPELMPALVDDLIEACLTRLAHLPDALTDDEAEALRRQQPRLAKMAAQLAALGIGVTIQHDDLHRGNVLVDEQGDLTIIDWGDASVTHPFTHLTVFASGLAHALGVTGDHPDVESARMAYLQCWADIAPIDELREAGRVAEHLGAVLRANSWRRALLEADDDSLREFGMSVPGWLRKLLPNGDPTAA